MKIKDDFNWENYTNDYYLKELNNEFIEKSIDLIVKNIEYDINGEIIFKDNLHQNWKELYHIIQKLKVNSIFECGFGCAHHLINNQIINPNLYVDGCDYSQNQLNLGFKLFNLKDYEFSNRLKILDMVDGTIEKDMINKYEFVYTQAVTMHLSYDRANKFLKNMKKLSNKYIFLIENLNSHNYDNLINDVFDDFEKIEEHKYLNNGILLKLK
jgi:hypothetical protein